MNPQQQLILKVKEHLLKQGKRSWEAETEMCQYHGPNRTSCAVGCLIPDELYNRDIEGRSALSLLKRQVEIREHIQKEFPMEFDDLSDLLCELQNVHDDQAVANWEHELDKMFNQYAT